MALLYYVKINNPNNVTPLPPSLNDSSYNTKLLAALAKTPGFSNPNGSYLQIFADQAELTAYGNSIALTAEESAVLTEWKTANNITSSYEVFELSTADGITVPTPFGN